VARIAVLVSVGRHPASGRARRAALDARAVELALRLPDARIELLHAGDPEAPALRDYLGMGRDRLRAIALPPGADIVPALVAALRSPIPDVVLAGTRAETGEGSGMVPYLVAEALGIPLVAAIADLRLEAGGAVLQQALPRGQRRAFSAPCPLLATVAAAAPAPRPVAFAAARRGRLDVDAAPGSPDPALAAWERSSARMRPKRLKGPVAGSAEDRIRAATRLVGGGGRAMVGPAPEEAARAIWEFLEREGIVPSARSREDSGVGH
jgi:electron transfer flavoprotein beta subunit